MAVKLISIHEVFADLDPDPFLRPLDLPISIHEVFADLDDDRGCNYYSLPISIHEVFADLDVVDRRVIVRYDLFQSTRSSQTSTIVTCRARLYVVFQSTRSSQTSTLYTAVELL